MHTRTLATSWLRKVAAKLFFLLAWIALIPVAASAQLWTVIGFDVKGDGRDSALPDAAQLAYRYDQPQDMLWFRIALYGKLNQDSFGVNIAVDTGADEAAKTNWWGGNKNFKFDQLVTAWVTRNSSGAYEGTIGIADADGARTRNLNNRLQNNLQIRSEADAVLIGMKRADLTDKMKMKLVVAVGSNHEWNDDMPNTGSITFDLSLPRPTRGIRELDFSRNNFQFAPGYKTLAENQTPRIVKRGHGHEALILVPGVYSGNQVFDGFIARNQSRYTFYVVTPPGLAGSAARALPPETTSYGEFTWTRRLERDLLELIGREKLKQPVIVTHGFPGSLAAHAIAVEHPEKIGGMIDVAGMPVQFMPSSDPGRPATPAERIAIVNEGWAGKWFKYVTPETWESNNYPTWMFTDNPERGEQIRKQVEATPLPVKIRYLTEFMASDDTDALTKLNVPLLAIRPGFNEKLFSDPANSWYKAMFLSAWDGFKQNPRIQVLTIPDARALVLDDQPQAADDAIAAFLRSIGKAQFANAEQNNKPLPTSD